jgi:hypothetical protein
MAVADEELRLMSLFVHRLDALDPHARIRVLGYLIARYASQKATMEISSSMVEPLAISPDKAEAVCRHPAYADVPIRSVKVEELADGA